MLAPTGGTLVLWSAERTRQCAPYNVGDHEHRIASAEAGHALEALAVRRGFHHAEHNEKPRRCGRHGLATIIWRTSGGGSEEAGIGEDHLPLRGARLRSRFARRALACGDGNRCRLAPQRTARFCRAVPGFGQNASRMSPEPSARRCTRACESWMDCATAQDARSASNVPGSKGAALTIRNRGVNLL